MVSSKLPAGKKSKIASIQLLPFQRLPAFRARSISFLQQQQPPQAASMSTQTDQTPNPSPIPTKKRTTRKRLRPCSNHSYELTTFCQPGRPISPTGPFQDNVVVFLQQCAELTDFRVQGMSVWFTLLRSRECLVPLFTIEETVDNSKTEFCDHCLSTGSTLLPYFLYILVFR